MIIFWSKFKAQIRKHPKLLCFFKFFTKLPIISFLNKKLSPATERFDMQRGDAEIEYVASYVKYIKGFINEFEKNNISLLDIGCGYGYVTEMIDQEKISKITAIDKINEKDFRAKDTKIKFIKADITQLYLDELKFEKFDIVSSTEFIEHISESDGRKLIGWIFKHIHNGGMFIGSTPNNVTTMDKYSDSPFHVREYSISDFRKILEETGFLNIEIKQEDNFFVWKAFYFEK
jgi:2-polyprenyl-3-methyl-5-hydroxy-6-metoxy-1,4-benzoquinol methylase